MYLKEKTYLKDMYKVNDAIYIVHSISDNEYSDSEKYIHFITGPHTIIDIRIQSLQEYDDTDKDDIQIDYKLLDDNNGYLDQINLFENPIEPPFNHETCFKDKNKALEYLVKLYKEDANKEQRTLAKC